MMENFAEYAEYYNVLYRKKNYKKEVDYIGNLIRDYGWGNKKITLLDVGCGTGNHDFWFAKKGYRVAGIDKSAKMIAIAKQRALKEPKVKFYLGEVSHFRLSRKFEVAVALFHVMSYITTNEAFIKSLQNIHSHLNKRGLFIFDFWYGPAVLIERPIKKTKRIFEKDTIIQRTATPKINLNDNTVDVNYKLCVFNKGRGLTKVIKEKHKMRYFFLPELDFMLKLCGFRVLRHLNRLSLRKGPAENSWSALIVAQKD